MTNFGQEPEGGAMHAGEEVPHADYSMVEQFAEFSGLTRGNEESLNGFHLRVAAIQYQRGGIVEAHEVLGGAMYADPDKGFDPDEALMSTMTNPGKSFSRHRVVKEATEAEVLDAFGRDAGMRILLEREGIDAPVIPLD